MQLYNIFFIIRPQHSPKVTVKSAIRKRGIIGYYLFEKNEIAVTLNSDCCIIMINSLLELELRKRCISRYNFWFQQDGVTAHTERTLVEAVRALFPNRVISVFGDIHWTLRLPNLSICYFFLGEGGYIKSRKYQVMMLSC